MEPCCNECDLLCWHGKKLPLELRHINGAHDDNRAENPAILCPNCHSLTPNYCGKNMKRRKNRQARKPGNRRVAFFGGVERVFVQAGIICPWTQSISVRMT